MILTVLPRIQYEGMAIISKFFYSINDIGIKIRFNDVSSHVDLSVNVIKDIHFIVGNTSPSNY